MNVFCLFDVHLRRWQVRSAHGQTRCTRCGATWPYRTFTTEELFPGVADRLDRTTEAEKQ